MGFCFSYIQNSIEASDFFLLKDQNFAYLTSRKFSNYD